MRLLESISVAHLDRMTDHQGLLACAIHDVPDPYRGHRTRDNAEALRLLAGLRDHDDTGDPPALAVRCFNFLRSARRDDHTLHHHRDATGHWTSPNDDDTVIAHVAWSLATVLTSDLPGTLKTEADDWLARLVRGWRLNFQVKITSSVCHGSVSRASGEPTMAGGPDPSDLCSRLAPLALWILALTKLPPNHALHDATLIAQLAATLIKHQDLTQRDTGWNWLTPRWSPGAARISTALWHAADALDDANLYRAARSTTEFIIDTHFEEGLFLPVGTRGWQPGQDKAIFDQRPLEAATVTELLATAAQATADARYGQYAEYAFRWFHGNNIRGQDLTHPATGACHNAIRKRGTDTNQHAAPTLAWLNAHTHIQSRQAHTIPATLAIAMK